MSSKSVLGDDPFAPAAPAGEAKPAEPAAARPRPNQQPAETNPAQQAKAPAEAGDKSKPAAKGERTKPAAEKQKPNKARSKAKSADSPAVETARTPSAPPLADGAAARRAARATSSVEMAPLGAPVTRAEAESDRLISRQLSRLQPQPGGALERAGRSYSRWIAELRMRDRSDSVDEFGFDPVIADRWRPLLEFLYRNYWRVETSGIENIPDHDAAMIVANHAGTFPYDGAMIMSAVKYDHPAHRDVRPLVEDFIFHFPFLGVALNRIGCVRACPENAERLLRHGGLVAVFPEGIKGIGKLYKQRYQLQRFGRGGFVKLALQTRAPIVPAAVIGAEEIHPMLGRITWLAKYLGIPYVPLTPTFPWLGALGTIPLPTKWQIRFGEPIDFAAEHGPAAAQDRVMVHRLTEQVRSTIQGMVDEALLNRRSIIFG